MATLFLDGFEDGEDLVRVCSDQGFIVELSDNWSLEDKYDSKISPSGDND